jgi:carbonic anhydrase
VFTTRTGTAVMDDSIVGSMEFAVSSPYETPLIVILGHTGCGAVTAGVDAMQADPSNPSAPGEVLDIVNEIVPIARHRERNRPHRPTGSAQPGQGGVRRRRGARQ